MELSLQPKQQLQLSQSQRLSLFVLQLPIDELDSYLLRQSDDNPMLDVELPSLTQSLSYDSLAQDLSGEFGSYSAGVHPLELHENLTDLHDWRTPSFNRYIMDQLSQTHLISVEMLPHCLFIAESLDRRGYFTEDLSEIATILNISLDTAEQALFLVQQMHPTGVGARTLEECLFLQLLSSPLLNEYTLKLISQDLTQYHPVDFDKMAQFIQTTPEQARTHWEGICSLNPIPSRGYHHGEPLHYIRPEATVEPQGELFLPHFPKKEQVKAKINTDYAHLVTQSPSDEVVTFLTKHQAAAEQVLFAVSRRASTLTQIITCVVAHQQDYFRDGDKGLRPLSIAQIAQELDLHSSTVSRGIRDKYLATPQGLIPLKSLFSTGITTNAQSTSRVSISSRIKALIEHEDKAKPLSDAKLQSLLAQCSIEISRRTVTKYREELKIPSSTQRKIVKNR